jgi:hypothetical protein
MTNTPDSLGTEAVGIAEEQPLRYGHHPRLLQDVPKHIGKGIVEATIAILNGMPAGHFDDKDRALLTRYALCVALLQDDAAEHRPIDLALIEELVLLSDMLHVSPRARHMLASARDLVAKQNALVVLRRDVN